MQNPDVLITAAINNVSLMGMHALTNLIYGYQVQMPCIS